MSLASNYNAVEVMTDKNERSVKRIAISDSMMLTRSSAGCLSSSPESRLAPVSGPSSLTG
jgi:hypothetical protein